VPSASAHRLIPDCRISVAGKKLDTAKDAALTRVDVDLDGDLFGQCVLTFNDPKMVLINGKDFKSGTAIKVEIGFHTKLKKVFEGEVVALEPVFRRDSPPSLKVVCQESLHRLALCQMTRAFNDVDDKEIATRIAREHGLTAQAPAGTKEHILQGNITDAAFLRRLAAKAGNTLRIEGKKLIIGPPAKGADVQVNPGDGLRKIKVQVKANTQVGEVSVHGWDAKAKKEIVFKAKPQGATQDGAKKHGQGSTLSIAGHAVIPADTASAEKMAKGRLRKIAEGFIQAQGDMVGNPGVLPGAVLNLDKMGAQIDGQYRVEHAVHAFSKHGYLVNFKAVKIGKKKPPKPVKHTWTTPPPGPSDQYQDVEIGPNGQPIVRARDDKTNVKWKKPKLTHLVLFYDEGKGVDDDVNEDWEKKKQRPKLDDVQIEYDASTHTRRDGDPEFQKVKNIRLEKLRFGYQRHFGPSPEQEQERKKAEGRPRLEDLEESYVPGKGKPPEE
jgi:phage protein D